MEDALALLSSSSCLEICSSRLNPCCNGRCTRTNAVLRDNEDISFVLILVVMEDALALWRSLCIHIIHRVLILVVMEDALALPVLRVGGQEYPRVLILVVMEDALAHIDTRGRFNFEVLILVVMEDALALDKIILSCHTTLLS